MFDAELIQLQKLYKEGLFSNLFYSRWIKGPDCLSSYGNFIKIPFMCKSDIRNSTVFERTTIPKEDVFGIFSSSGSTGSKTYYVYSKEDKYVHSECVKRFLEPLGIGKKDLGAILAPVDTGVMAQTMMWQYSIMGAGYVNCVQPNPENIIELIKKVPITVASSRPEVLSSVGISDDWQQELKKSEVRLLLAGGGFLSEQRRKYLESTWDCECYNLFGMSEVFGPMASECLIKKGQHYPNDYIMIEVIDPDTKMPVKNGEMGIAVYTTLWKKGFPLIRYWTDDFIHIDHSPCSCGSQMPRFFYHGRMNDCFCINGNYVFPKEFEEIIIDYGYAQDYEVVLENNEIIIDLEAFPYQRYVDNSMKEKLILLFQLPCTINFKEIGTIDLFKTHGKHFKVREIK